MEEEGEEGKGNIIGREIRGCGKGRRGEWVIDDSVKMVDKVIGDRFGVIGGISF